MEKQTKILVGLGAAIAAYLILKPKKHISIKYVPSVTPPVEPLVTPLVESAPLEQLPIFTNPIDDFINPIVPVEPSPIVPIESSPIVPVEPVVTPLVESAPLEQLPIFTNPIDDFINPIVPIESSPIVPFEPVAILPIEINTADQFVFQKPIVYSLNATFGNNFGDVCTNSYQNTLLYTLDSIIKIGSVVYKDELLTIPFNKYFSIGDGNVYGCYDNGEIAVIFEGKCNEIINKVQSVINDLNTIQNISNSSIKSSDDITTLNNAISNVEISLKEEYVTQLLDNNNVNYDISNEKAYVEDVITEKNKVVEVGSVSFIVGNDVNEICNHPYYTGLGDEQFEVVNLYLDLQNWNPITRENPIGYKLYKDSSLKIPYKDSTFITRWGTAERILQLDNNGTIVDVLPACQIKKVEVGGVTFVVNNDVYNLCQDPYFGGTGSASELVNLYINLADWGKLSNNTIGLKLYKDRNLSKVWKDTKYMVRWGNRDLPVFEIDPNTGAVINVLSPCYVINVENNKLQQEPILISNPIDSFVYSAPVESQSEKVENYITIGNAINDFTVLGSLHRDYRIGQIRSYATNIINSDKIKIGDKIRIYKSDDVYILGIVTEYNKSNGLLKYKEEDSFAPSDNVMYSGFSIQVLTT